MEVKPLGESPEVIHLFESMEQNRLYVEKSQMEEVVAHMDELLTSIKQIEKELADMRNLTGNPDWMRFLLSSMGLRITPWNMMTGLYGRRWNVWWWSPRRK